MNDTAVESPLVEELEVDSYAVGQPPVAAAHDDRGDELPKLVNKAGSDGLGRQVRSAD